MRHRSGPRETDPTNLCKPIDPTLFHFLHIFCKELRKKTRNGIEGQKSGAIRKRKILLYLNSDFSISYSGFYGAGG
jgi:hypothetical protein